MLWEDLLLRYGQHLFLPLGEILQGRRAGQEGIGEIPMIARMIGIEIVTVEKGGDMDKIGAGGQLVQEPGVDTTGLPG